MAEDVTLSSAKVDLKKQLPAYSASAREFSIVTVPPARFLMIDGHGDPNTSQGYANALQTLYPVAYALKFLSKRALGRDYAVMPLEALWWSDDMDAFTTQRDKSRWDWTVLNMVPDWITDEHFSTVRETARRKGRAPAIDDIRLDVLDEGQCVQRLHVGSYDDEAPVLDELHNSFVRANSLRLRGKHHEIYLSDARRTPPAKLRTILRQPVDRVVP